MSSMAILKTKTLLVEKIAKLIFLLKQRKTNFKLMTQDVKTFT